MAEVRRGTNTERLAGHDGRQNQAAGGSLPGHLLSVFLFGVLHVNEIKASRGAN